MKQVSKPARPARKSATKAPPQELGPKASLSDQAYKAIRDALRQGSIRPGDRVKERELAAKLALGRTPVREAIKRLAVQGLLAHDAGQGLVFKKLGQRDLVEIHTVWATLQGLAAQLAARNATAVEVEAMRMVHQRLAQECETDVTKALRTARRLDQMIYDASHNDYLARHIAQLIDTVGLQAPTSTFTIPGRAKAFANEMAEVIDAIAKRDPERAERCGREHNEKGLAARLALDFYEG